MLEAFLFYNRENLKNIENVIQSLYDESSDEEEEGEEKENDIMFEEDIEATFKLSDCNCLMCQSLNNL